MVQVLTALILSMTSFLASAAVSENSGTPVELPPPDATGLLAFLVIMVVMVAGYAFYIRKKERERRERDADKP